MTSDDFIAAAGAGASPDLFDFNLSGCETIESALAACGWRTNDARSWTHGSGRNKVLLTEIAETIGWRHFVVRQRNSETRTTASILFDNFQLVGPMKLVMGPGSAPEIRLDVPTEFGHADTPALTPLDFSAVMSPTFFWAKAVTTGLANLTSKKMHHSAAEGKKGDLAVAHSSGLLPAEQIASQLQSTGWAATAEEGQVYVSVSLPGIFRQVEIAGQIEEGILSIVVSCHLVDLPEEDVKQEKNVGDDGSTPRTTADASARTLAIVHLAQQVNARLPLVRMAIDARTRPWRLRSEVCFCGGPIPGTWLMTALEAVQSAIAATALEFEALSRDAELANLVLAASAGGIALEPQGG